MMGMGMDTPARTSVLCGPLVLRRPKLRVRSGTTSRLARMADASAPPERARAAFRSPRALRANAVRAPTSAYGGLKSTGATAKRSEEHTSELQSRLHLVCRLLLEKKKIKILNKI